MKLSINNISYKSNSIESKKTNNALLMISGGAMLTPLIPFIDGEPLKKTYKDRNISKYATGLAAVGGAVVATRILSDKFIPETKTEKQKTIVLFLFWLYFCSYIMLMGAVINWFWAKMILV